mmetsp:Transcript_33764/g.98231  ORF Transcript_33764/g.98231 Transcript_33764/m.98231 type:complete len:383 (+) Transcript_33764:64-1212(+)
MPLVEPPALPRFYSSTSLPSFDEELPSSDDQGAASHDDIGQDSDSAASSRAPRPPSGPRPRFVRPAVVKTRPGAAPVRAEGDMCRCHSDSSQKSSGALLARSAQFASAAGVRAAIEEVRTVAEEARWEVWVSMKAKRVEAAVQDRRCRLERGGRAAEDRAGRDTVEGGPLGQHVDGKAGGCPGDRESGGRQAGGRPAGGRPAGGRQVEQAGGRQSEGHRPRQRPQRHDAGQPEGGRRQRQEQRRARSPRRKSGLRRCGAPFRPKSVSSKSWLCVRRLPTAYKPATRTCGQGARVRPIDSRRPCKSWRMPGTARLSTVGFCSTTTPRRATNTTTPTCRGTTPSFATWIARSRGWSASTSASTRCMRRTHASERRRLPVIPSGC